MDYSKFYDLENYLFQDVSKKFKEAGYIDAFDFFCIIIWKANRAKTNIKSNLIKIGNSENLNEICKKLTSDLFLIKDNKQKLQFLLNKWKFRLRTASAILTILYPNNFTIFDYRVTETLIKYKYLLNKTKIKDVIEGYFNFLEDVKKEVIEKNTLREKDKYLWGASFYKELKNDIEDGFKRLEKK